MTEILGAHESWASLLAVFHDRQTEKAGVGRPFLSHIPPILPTHLIQRMADLPEAVGLHRFDQRGEQVFALAGGVLEVGETGRAWPPLPLPLSHEGGGERGGVAVLLVAAHVGDLLALFFLGAADQLDGGGDLAAVVLAEVGVDAHQRQAAVVLLVLVVQALFLDLAALVHGVHGAQHAAALADGFELLVHGLFHQVGELVDHEAALPGVLVEVQAQLFVDDHLDGHGAAHAFFRRRGDGLVVGVGVQAVAVVEQGVQRLQRGADVVELDLLRVQGAA